MPRWIALLRGINVGGNKIVPMADLRVALEKLGHEDVATLVQSGNVVFGSKQKSEAKLVAELEPALAKRFGFPIPVILRSRDELAGVIAKNPLRAAEADPSRLLVFFLSATPDAAKVKAIDAAAYAPDEFRVAGREIYACFPSGMGNSKLGTVLGGTKLGVTPTARNWNTVTKLLALADG